MTLERPSSFKHPLERPVGTDLWNHTIGTQMPLERSYFVGTGYLAPDAADMQTVAVCVQDVARVACGYMADREPVIQLVSTNGFVLAGLPWPEGVDDERAAVRWWLNAAAEPSQPW